MSHGEHRMKELYQGWNTAFIDGTYSSNLAYRPEFISNNINRVKKYWQRLNRSYQLVMNFVLVLPLLQKVE